MSTGSGPDEFDVSEEETEPLGTRQLKIYNRLRSKFAEYLLEEGKDPRRGKGYPRGTVTVKLSRHHRVMKFIWETEEKTTDLTTDYADTVITALDTDDFRRTNGERYAEGSKRKISNVLENWFEFRGVEWEPDIVFSDERASDNADPFRKPELQELWQASLTYKDIPSYNNLSPEERDEWKGYIAQDLGKPKEDVVPADWGKIDNWKISSLIRTTRSNGWRPALIGRLSVDWYNPETKTIEIPEGKAVKNDSPWDVELTDEGAFALEKWLEQRGNIEKYDGRDEVWLNREGNPYDSGALNNLLDNLMDEAGIEPGTRKLVWYSFRHSIGTYVYDEYKDLKIVAEQLRQNSRDSASRYVHPRPELKREAANIM